MARLLRRCKISGWRRHIKIAWRSEDLSPSLRARQTFHGFRNHVSPDFVFARGQIVLFVDGCFWHGCPQHTRLPKSRIPFWSAKLLRNRQRDEFVDDALCELGWTVLRVWEHELAQLEELSSRLREHLPTSTTNAHTR
jgi:DNA mismatch endonuclease, patch repair protein